MMNQPQANQPTDQPATPLTITQRLTALQEKCWEYMQLGTLLFTVHQLGIPAEPIRLAYEQGGLFAAHEAAGWLLAERTHQQTAQTLRDQEGIARDTPSA